MQERIITDVTTSKLFMVYRTVVHDTKSRCTRHDVATELTHFTTMAARPADQTRTSAHGRRLDFTTKFKGHS